MRKPKISQSRAPPPKNTPVPVLDLEERVEEETQNKINFVQQMRGYQDSVTNEIDIKRKMEEKLKLTMIRSE